MTDDNDSFEHALEAMRAVDSPSAQRSADARRAIVDALSAPSHPTAVRAKSRAFVGGLLLAAALGGSAFAATAVRWARSPRASASSTVSAAHTANNAPRSTLASRTALAPSQRPEPALIAPPVEAPRALGETARTQESITRTIALSSPSIAARAVPTARANAQRAIAQSTTVPQQALAARSVEPARTTTVSMVDALYTAAHEAHFTQRDPALALARWDVYLSESPAGSFAPEAQFNRIVCLVRLGRRADAIAAIRALPESHYRFAEAQRLLERLGAP